MSVLSSLFSLSNTALGYTVTKLLDRVHFETLLRDSHTDRINRLTELSHTVDRLICYFYNSLLDDMHQKSSE